MKCDEKIPLASAQNFFDFSVTFNQVYAQNRIRHSSINIQGVFVVKQNIFTKSITFKTVENKS